MRGEPGAQAMRGAGRARRATIDAEAAQRIQRTAFRYFLDLIGRSHPDSRVVELDGVAASVVPATPDRSIANSVIYRDPDSLAAGLGELAAVYERAGVNAWTVWCPPTDREGIGVLERAGHVLDGTPAAMVLELARFAEPDLGDLDWDAAASPELMARLNDAAYGLTRENGFGIALERPPPELGLRIYQARLEGEPVCVLGTLDHRGDPDLGGPDCGIYFVATDERARGRGLATRLLSAALVEARERGCRTSSLQSSSMGEPVYAALGYRSYFRFGMYERRRRKDSGLRP